jgi:hypothetical protein
VSYNGSLLNIDTKLKFPSIKKLYILYHTLNGLNLIVGGKNSFLGFYIYLYFSLLTTNKSFKSLFFSLFFFSKTFDVSFLSKINQNNINFKKFNLFSSNYNQDNSFLVLGFFWKK